MADTKLDPKDVEMFKKFMDVVKETSSSYSGLIKKSKEFKKSIEETEKEIKNLIKPINTFDENVEDTLDDLSRMNRNIKRLHLKKAFSPKDVDSYNKQLMMMARQIAKINTLQKKGDKAGAKALMEDVRKVKERIKIRMQNKEGRADVKADFKSPGFYKGMAKTISSAPDVLSVMGNAAKGLGGILGKVSTTLAGWPASILLGVKALWDMGMAADEYVKNANKAFATVRGPDIMTGDVKKQFKDFNNQIYKAGENIRVGLNVTQIRELMHAMSGAGLNITTLNKGLSNYRDAIYVAAKASKTLGVELPAVGNMMGTMINNFRMNMNKIDDTFIQIAFDAKKSGLTTDAFWTTVQNANASLALYGVAIKSASKTMSAFTENAVGGADDAAAATQDMFNVFKSGTISTQAAFLQFAEQGGANLKGMLGDQVKELEKNQGDLKKQILDITVKGTPEKGSALEEQLVKLRKELYSNQTKVQRFNAVMEGNAVEMTTEMGAFSKSAPELVMSVIKGMVPVGEDISKLTGQSLIVAQQAAATAGYSGTTVKMLVELATVTKNKLEDMAGRVSTLSADEKEYLSSASEEIKKVLETGSAEQIATMLKTPEAINAVTTSQFKVDEKSKDILAANAEDTFKAVVDQTLSYKEMIDIAKDEVQWRANSLGLLQGLNDGVFSIFKHMVGPGAKSEGQKSAQAALIGTGKFKAGIGGNISEADQTAGVHSLTKEVSKISARLLARKEYTKALSTPGSEGSIMAGYDRSFKATSDPKAKAQIAAQKAAFEKLVLEGKKSRKNNTELLQSNEEGIEIDGNALGVATESLNNLVTLNKTNAQTLEIARAQLEANPDFQKMVDERAKATINQGKSLLDFASTLPGGLETLKKTTDPAILKAIGKAEMGASIIGARSEVPFSAKGTKFATGVPTLVGENGAEIMTPPRGSQIFPHGILPPMGIPGGAGAGRGGGTKTFQITINASANPQQIANVVQSTINQMNIN